MNTEEQAIREENPKKDQIQEDDIDCKQSVTTETKTTLTPMTFTLTSTTTQCASSSSKNEPSEVSDSDSVIEKDILTPLGNPFLKNLNYVDREIPIYTNLYRLGLERDYTLYEYAVTFAYEKDDKYIVCVPLRACPRGIVQQARAGQRRRRPAAGHGDRDPHDGGPERHP